MNAQVQIEAQPEILRFYRGMSDAEKHKALQILIRETDMFERETEETADLFLAALASEIYPHNEGAQDHLYPIGGLNMEAARRHRLELERDVLAAERRIKGRAAMLCGRDSLSGAEFHNGAFGG